MAKNQDTVNCCIGDFEAGAVALLLDNSYRPITFINFRKLISLIVRGKVDVVSAWADVISPSLGSLPSVIRLTRNDLGNKVFSRRERKIYSRRIVLARDAYKCQYCNIELEPKDATIDHVLPRALGGQNSWTNCVACCFDCNSKKGHQVGFVLKRQPKPPSIIHFWKARTQLKQPWHADWGFYLK